jgi:hypothetical protein
MRSPPSPYRVLAFAVDCGDHPLAALLAARLQRPPRSGSGAAWRTLARIAVALDLA